jgi:hypothetical protein
MIAVFDLNAASPRSREPPPGRAAPSPAAAGQFRLALPRGVAAGQQQRGGQHQQPGGRDRGAQADEAGQQAPQDGQGRDRDVACDRPRGQGAGDGVS